MPPGNLRGHGAGVRGDDQHRQRRRPLPGNRGSNRSRGSVGNAQLVTGPATSWVAWGQAAAGRSWGTARLAMLAVQTPARYAKRSIPCMRQVAPSVSVAQWPAGERRDRVGHRVPGHCAGMAGAWACPAGRTTEAGMSSPNAAPPRFRDPGRVPPNGRSLPGAQQPVPARWRRWMASINRTCTETHPAPYPREVLRRKPTRHPYRAMTP